MFPEIEDIPPSSAFERTAHRLLWFALACLLVFIPLWCALDPVPYLPAKTRIPATAVCPPGYAQPHTVAFGVTECTLTPGDE